MTCAPPSLELVTAPAEEPITLVEAKAHLRVDDTADDTLITSLILAARTWCEDFTRRALVTQTWDAHYDGFPVWFEVQKPPLQSVTAANFTYVETDGTVTQVPITVYTVDAAAAPGRVYTAFGQTWPTPRWEPKNVSLRFVAGYGAAAAVPQPLKQAMLLHIGRLYENREPVVVGTSTTDTSADEALARPYQIAGF